MNTDACEPPHHLAVSTSNDWGTWRLEANLSHADGVTTLGFVHQLQDAANAGEIGPGWEYYPDLLARSRDGTEEPDFNDYFPTQQEHYDSFTRS